MHTTNERRFVIAVFNNRQTSGDAAFFSTLHRRHCARSAKSQNRDRAVINLRAVMLAQANEQHLHQSHFEYRRHFGMRLDATNHNREVRLISMLSKCTGKPSGA